VCGEIGTAEPDEIGTSVTRRWWPGFPPERLDASKMERRRRAGEPDDLSSSEFEHVVSEALDSLPKRFADLVRNVVISVEDEPSADDVGALDDESGAGTELLGIYRGVALTERTHDDPLLPDEIAIFRGPINRIAHTRAEAVDQVRETVIHELGHYFGLTDDDMPH
jgi:predicted Zn-dependent protease with MMP-like domain